MKGVPCHPRVDGIQSMKRFLDSRLRGNDGTYILQVGLTLPCALATLARPITAWSPRHERVSMAPERALLQAGARHCARGRSHTERDDRRALLRPQGSRP